MAGREGQPGAPGQPGHPGVRGGGTGGTGGAGGHGGPGASERPWLYAIAFIAIIAAGLGTGTLLLVNKVAHNTGIIKRQADEIQDLERIDVMHLRKADAQHASALQRIYHTDYRLCVRQQVVRAAIDSGHGGEPMLPVYDCRPNLHGDDARRLTTGQQRAFIRRVLKTPVARLP